jgi:hypothetical protein
LPVIVLKPSWSLYRGRARGRERVRPNERAVLKHTTTRGSAASPRSADFRQPSWSGDRAMRPVARRGGDRAPSLQSTPTPTRSPVCDARRQEGDAQGGSPSWTETAKARSRRPAMTWLAVPSRNEDDRRRGTARLRGGLPLSLGCERLASRASDARIGRKAIAGYWVGDVAGAIGLVRRGPGQPQGRPVALARARKSR